MTIMDKIEILFLEDIEDLFIIKMNKIIAGMNKKLPGLNNTASNEKIPTQTSEILGVIK